MRRVVSLLFLFSALAILLLSDCIYQGHCAYNGGNAYCRHIYGENAQYCSIWNSGCDNSDDGDGCHPTEPVFVCYAPCGVSSYGTALDCPQENTGSTGEANDAGASGNGAMGGGEMGDPGAAADSSMADETGLNSTGSTASSASSATSAAGDASDTTDTGADEADTTSTTTTTTTSQP